MSGSERLAPSPATPAVTVSASGRASGTRQRIVEAAEALLLGAESEEAVSVRALERQAGVTAPTIYRYFPDMSALLAEVATRQFERLNDAIAVATGHADPVLQIQEYGRAYARFALTHPNEYRVLLMNRTRDDQAASVRVREATGFQRLVVAVRAGIEAGRIAGDLSAEEVASLLVMSLHGVVSMIIARPDGWADPEALVEQMMQTMGLGLVPRES